MEKKMGINQDEVIDEVIRIIKGKICNIYANIAYLQNLIIQHKNSSFLTRFMYSSIIFDGEYMTEKMRFLK